MHMTLFPCPHKLPCDTYACRTMASWFIGREDGPLSSTSKYCEDCTKHMLGHLPDGLEINDSDTKEIESDGQETYIVISETGNILHIGTNEEDAIEVNVSFVGSHIEVVMFGKVTGILPKFVGDLDESESVNVQGEIDLSDVAEKPSRKRKSETTEVEPA